MTRVRPVFINYDNTGSAWFDELRIKPSRLRMREAEVAILLAPTAQRSFEDQWVSRLRREGLTAIALPPTAPLSGVRLAGRQVCFFSDKAARRLGWKAADWRPALRAAIEWFDEQGLLRKDVSKPS